MPTIAQSSRRIIRIGPEDNGRRMSLSDFDRAVGQEGWCYELGKGVIEVTNVPGPDHFAQVQEIRDQFAAYRTAHRDRVYGVAGSNECKILLAEDQSERHPDVSIYLTPPPDVKDVWSVWVPAIVVEVVSARSAKRDYQDKRSEYFNFGVAEYLIVDASKKQMTVLERWRGHWRLRIVRADQKYVTQLLPGFSLNLKLVFGVK